VVSMVEVIVNSAYDAQIFFKDYREEFSMCDREQGEVTPRRQLHQVILIYLFRRVRLIAHPQSTDNCLVLPDRHDCEVIVVTGCPVESFSSS